VQQQPKAQAFGVQAFGVQPKKVTPTPTPAAKSPIATPPVPPEHDVPIPGPKTPKVACVRPKCRGVDLDLLFTAPGESGRTVYVMSCSSCGGRVGLEDDPGAPMEQGVVVGQGLAADVRPKTAPAELEVKREDPTVPDGKVETEFAEHREHVE
jgi:hypothetical protein